MRSTFQMRSFSTLLHLIRLNYWRKISISSPLFAASWVFFTSRSQPYNLNWYCCFPEFYYYHSPLPSRSLLLHRYQSIFPKPTKPSMFTLLRFFCHPIFIFHQLTPFILHPQLRTYQLSLRKLDSLIFSFSTHHRNVPSTVDETIS